MDYQNIILPVSRSLNLNAIHPESFLTTTNKFLRSLMSCMYPPLRHQPPPQYVIKITLPVTVDKVIVTMIEMLALGPRSFIPRNKHGYSISQNLKFQINSEMFDHHRVEPSCRFPYRTDSQSYSQFFENVQNMLYCATGSRYSTEGSPQFQIDIL